MTNTPHPATISKLPPPVIQMQMPNAQQMADEYQRERYQHMHALKQHRRTRLETECRMRAVLAGKPLPEPGRLRLPGGGRKSLVEKYPDIIPALYSILTPPRTPEFVPPIQWTTLTNKEIASRLCAEGFRVSASSIPSLLYRAGLRSHPTVRIPKKRPCPKDKQFDFINRNITEALRNNQRVYFVDFHIVPNDVAPEPDLEAPEANTPDIVYKHRCQCIADHIFDVLKYLWYDIRDEDSTPMIVLEGGTLLGIANDYFHKRLEDLATEKGFNVLLSYLPTGISRWTCAKRDYETQRLIHCTKQTFDTGMIAVDEILKRPRWSSVTGGTPTLRQQFRDEVKDLGLYDWNRILGEQRFNDLQGAAGRQLPEIIEI